MQLEQLKNELIPDYRYLSTEQRQVFERSEKGIAFTALAQKHVEAFNNLSTIKYWGYKLLGWTSPTHEQVTAQWNQAKIDFTTHFKNTSEHTLIQEYITHQHQLLHQQKIAEKLAVLIERTHKLAQFFPLLTNASTNNAMTRLIDTYKKRIEQENFSPHELEVRQLASLLVEYLHKASEQIPPSCIDSSALHQFNTEQSLLLAQKIIHTFNHNAALHVDTLFIEYKKNLQRCIKNTLLSVHGVRRNAHFLTTHTLVNALSNLIGNNFLVTQSTHYISQIAEAHAFLTRTRFTSQSDSTLSTILELYNSHRIRKEVSEVRSILSKMLLPFKPLYKEFKALKMYKKKPGLMVFNVLTPLLIILAFVVLVSLLLAPLAIPEAIIAMLIVPVLAVIGTLLASAYVFIKNRAYTVLRQKYYGGPFEIPEFQVNERMQRSFTTEEKAKTVRVFYVEELKQCDTLEKEYQQLEAHATLTTAQWEHRQENKKRRCALYLEWYDIHSNAAVGIDDVAKIMLKRLHLDLDKACEVMEHTWDAEDSGPIMESINSVVEEMQTTLIHAATTAASPPAVFVPQEDKHTKTTPPLKPSLRFFKPKCITHKDKAEYLDTLIGQLNGPAAA